MATTIEEILAKDDAHREEVPVKEWGVSVPVVSMTAEERSELEKRWQKKDATSDPAAFRRDVLELTLKYPDGKPFATPEQIKLLMGKNANAIETLFEAGSRLSALNKKDIEALTKN
jgi:hypothetical protein